MREEEHLPAWKHTARRGGLAAAVAAGAWLVCLACSSLLVCLILSKGPTHAGLSLAEELQDLVRITICFPFLGNNDGWSLEGAFCMGLLLFPIIVPVGLILSGFCDQW